MYITFKGHIFQFFDFKDVHLKEKLTFTFKGRVCPVRGDFPGPRKGGNLLMGGAQLDWGA